MFLHHDGATNLQGRLDRAEIDTDDLQAKVNTVSVIYCSIQHIRKSQGAHQLETVSCVALPTH